MIGWLRVFLMLAVFVAATLALVARQLVVIAFKGDMAWGARTWHRMVLRLLDFRVHVTGTLSGRRPLLIASNHISWTDIMVIGSRADVHFIAKADVRQWPLFGWLARMQRTVYVDRDNRGGAGEQAAEIGRRLASGDAMVLFAEGSTFDGNRIGPFKTSLFAAAGAALAEPDVEEVWIQPVAVVYTRLHGMPMGRQLRPHVAWTGSRTLVPHLIDLLRSGGVDVELRFGEPFSFTRASNRKAAAAEAERQVRAMMRAALAAPRK